MVAQRKKEEAAANAARLAAERKEAEAKAKMKGKNRPSRRHRKKQTNIIEDRKPAIKQRQQEEVRGGGVGSGLRAARGPSAWCRIGEVWAGKWGGYTGLGGMKGAGAWPLWRYDGVMVMR